MKGTGPFLSDLFHGFFSLLNKAKAFAISENAKGLTLETEVTNPAQKLYERLDWIKDTEVFHYTWKV